MSSSGEEGSDFGAAQGQSGHGGDQQGAGLRQEHRAQTHQEHEEGQAEQRLEQLLRRLHYEERERHDVSPIYLMILLRIFEVESSLLGK